MFKTENEVVNSTGGFKGRVTEKMISKLGLCGITGSCLKDKIVESTI